jgi:hypothetical protein
MRSSSLSVAIALTLIGCASPARRDDQAIEPDLADAVLPAAPTPRLPGSGSAEGVLGGTSLMIAEAIVLAGPLSERDPSRRGVRIVLTTDASACTRVDTVRAGGAAMSFDIDSADGTLAPGTYSVPAAFAEGPDSVFAQLDGATADCRRKTVVAGAGNVIIATSEGGRIRGSFALTSGRDTIRGVFDAAPCSVAAPPPMIVRCQ